MIDEERRVWEPWVPEIGQRVRVRLSAECQTRMNHASPPPSVSDRTLRDMMRARVDVAARFARDDWMTGHPGAMDGVEGTVTDIDQTLDDGHYYRVMFDRNTEPDDYVGCDLAAIELEPIS